MFVVLAGPDGSGKSTLAKLLSDIWGVKVVSSKVPAPEMTTENLFQYYMDLINDNDHLILDRSWYCELVYGPIMRGKSLLDIKHMNLLEEALLLKHGFIIHCSDTAERLWERCNVRGEDYVKDFETLDLIKEGYDHLFNEIDHKIQLLTYTINDNKGVD